jgi:uncharacterized protein (DUF1778 family)
MDTQIESTFLDAAIPVEERALLKRAAELQGGSVGDFIVRAIREAAIRTIESVEVIELSTDDQILLAKGLINPPEPSEALREAFQKRNELFGPA